MNNPALGAIEVVLILTVVLLWLWSVIWAARDARRRGKSGFLVALLVIFLAWPLGLLVWLILRPRLREPGDGRFH